MTPLVKLFARRYCANDSRGEPIGMTWRVFRAGRLVSVGQQTASLALDCSLGARLRVPGGIERGRSYTATFELNDANGILLTRRALLRGT